MAIDFFEYAELVNTLNDWAAKYEAGNSPVDDSVYDTEYRKLKLFEKLNPGMLDPNSPTQKTGATIKSDGFEKVQHVIPMLSIANIYSEEELREWVNDKTSKGINEFVMEFKIDGLALSLPYVTGDLDDAITRGQDGVGDRVLANAMMIDSIPKSTGFVGEVRGEAVWNKADFIAFNEQQALDDNELMSNPRNGAAGTMKSKDPYEVKRRKLSFIAYSIVDGGNATHSADLVALGNMGFTVSPHYILTDVDAIVDCMLKMEQDRHHLPYLTDGLVIKVNDKSAYKKLGGTAKTPHALGAYKFPAEIKATPLIDVEESSGKTGAVTPVANVVMVELSLTEVRRSTMSNWDIFEFMGVYTGCSVLIRKSGEIIPEIIGVVGIDGHTKDDYQKLLAIKGRDAINAAIKELRVDPQYKDLPFIFRPTICKHCGATLEQDSNHAGEDLVALVCVNDLCPIKKFKAIENFVSKKRMNIMGIGESTVEDLLNYDVIKNVTDIYRITKVDLLKIPSMKDRGIEKVLRGIDASRGNHMHQLLSGLGIDGLGTTASTKLSDHFNSLEAVFNATESEILSIDGIGPMIARNIIEYGQIKENRDIVDFFIINSIACKSKPTMIKGTELTGLTLIMTGSSGVLGRNEFKQLVPEHGGKISSSISKKTNIVVLCDEAGPVKIKQIKQLQSEGCGIKTITDLEFLKMVGK